MNRFQREQEKEARIQAEKERREQEAQRRAEEEAARKKELLQALNAAAHGNQRQGIKLIFCSFFIKKI